MPQLSSSQREALMSELGGLRRFCFSLTGNGADADDLLQTTVERILEKGMPTDASTAKWAYRVCRNAWIDELRSREVRHRYPQQVEPVEALEPSAEALVSQERELVDVSVALGQLPTEQRLALSLVAVDGKSYAEAAEILDVPTGTVMSRIARARKALVKIWADREADHQR